MVTGQDILARLNAEQMTTVNAMESIHIASGLYLSTPCLTQIIKGMKEAPDWLTLDMIDWKHIRERNHES